MDKNNGSKSNLTCRTCSSGGRVPLGLLVVLLSIVSIGTKGDYVVINVSGGVDADTYPVSHLDAPPESGWSAEYKTDKIVLAKMNPGSFVRRRLMADYPYISTNSSDQFSVSVTRPYYIGVFPVTQRQWELVTGKRPSSFKEESTYAMRPVDSVSYTTIRGERKGTSYPHTTNVDESSFIGILRKKAGIPGIDIPTEDQWEYACHAGKATQYGNGEDNPVAMLDLGRYEGNSGGTTVSKNVTTAKGTNAVGEFQPNAWGLYDMQGGIWEWCLDAVDQGNVPPMKSPLSFDVYRILKGGHWGAPSLFCAASARAGRCGSIGWDCCGVRLVLNGYKK